ncbi:MAG: GNAT family N-acetyltransferase [Hamadaea sp.]|uniref:GNAT family N-acetyltransferase n=1 Tax=Hamadaea sp. TaxID=2024425 RepID=UPI001833C7F2|nr:GNAT family N-acetyltransferase [Hamadaea sp.]NUT22571.1 GNAT family N-acetyltransferase [Hamadaea sp.]
MPELIEPTQDRHRAWLAFRDEWGGEEMHGTGVSAKYDVNSAEGFAAWVAYLRRQGDPSVPVDEGRVHADYWWIVEDGVTEDGETEDGEIVGAITLRHELNAFLAEAGGHIGYGVRPSARQRGIAGWALAEVLRRARERGMDRVLITCDDANVGSARTIERNGGVLEDVRDTALGRTRRYWVNL